MNDQDLTLQLRHTLQQETDRCVLCGLCLAHCPTYKLTRNEAESPRGRVVMLQQLARENLSADSVLQEHIDNCLLCRACERMCPSKVNYSRILDSGRALLRQQTDHQPAALQQLLKTAARPTLSRLVGKALHLYQNSSLRSLAEKTGLLEHTGLAELERQLPTRSRHHKHSKLSKAQEARGRVLLHPGCIGSGLEKDLQQSAANILQALGYELTILKKNPCCGALHQHSGEPANAEELARTNHQLFEQQQAEAVLVSSSGCLRQFADYATLYDLPETLPVYELSDFIAAQPWPEHLQATGLNGEPVVLHQPCSQPRSKEDYQAMTTLLGHIPGLQLIPYPDLGCCGAGGSHMVTRPQHAAAIREPHLEWLAVSGARILCTTNIGCALHLAAGLQSQGIELEVLHPLQLLERALVAKSPDALS